MNSVSDGFFFVRNLVCSIENRELHIDLFERGAEYSFNSIPLRLKYTFKEMYNDIENHHYTFNEVLVYIVYYYMFNSKIFSYFSLNKKNIKEVTEIFNQHTYERDKKFILDLCMKNNITNKDRLFEVSVDGKCAIYDLIMKKYISPIFFIKNCNNYLTTYENSNILLEPEFERFVFVTKVFINNYLRSA